MFFLILLLSMGSLPHYEVTIDPIHYGQLIANPPNKDLEFPASISFNGESGDCTISLRGGTSLGCRKKSWHITIDDPSVVPLSNGHLLLNAQFRDASLMRNTLGHYITRELGFPAPETEFVTLSINNVNKGVYESVERIDRFFYERNGLSFGPLFKNVDTLGRLSHHYSDTTGLAGYEPKIDSSPYGNQLLELIEACLREDVSSLVTGEFLAAFAVHVAICDNDGVIKNFYLHKYNDLWHYYPWDRDATFGNTWEGEYISSWVTKEHLGDICNFGATRGIFSSAENMNEFNNLLFQTTNIIRDDLPQMVDSIRLLIRDDLAQDPYYQYSIHQFDSLCAVIISDLELRSDFLTNLVIEDKIPKIEELSISSCLDMQSSLEVELALSGRVPEHVTCLVSFDGQPEVWLGMEEDKFEFLDEDESEWEIELTVPPGTYSIHMAFGPYGPNTFFPVFYPSWCFRNRQEKPDPTPSARVALANLSPDLLSPGIPLWCGENLWVLPIVNTSTEQQDISLCRFSLGEPEGNVFLPESILISPGETFYLSNSSERAEQLFSGLNIFGDAGAFFPAGTHIKLYDPAWNSIYQWSIASGDSLSPDPCMLIPSEICAQGGNDWIEFYNCSDRAIDLSEWYLMDSSNNVSLFPDGTTLSPWGIVLAANDTDLFPSATCEKIDLTFGLNSKTESLSLYSGLGNLIFSLVWDENWPMDETGIMFLKNAQAPLFLASSWESVVPPGSPGSSNPGWTEHSDYTRVSLTSKNPGNGAFSFHYETSSVASEAFLYDLTGRIVSRIDLPENYEGSIAADFSHTLPNGVYVLFIKSSTGSASTRLTVLH